MNGNVTEDGVRLDLEWMKRVGVGGVHHFDACFELNAGFDTPTQVDVPLPYRSEGWQRTFRYSVELARRLGLELGIASSAGFSESAAPWVSPRDAMKKLVWSETFVRGGEPLSGRLPEPPHTSGLFQNIPLVELNGRWNAPPAPAWHADVAVVAFRLPDCEVPSASLNLVATSSAGALPAARLCDGDLASVVHIPFGEGPHAWIQFDFAKPMRIQALTFVIERPVSWDPVKLSGPAGRLEASTDGTTFHTIQALPRTGALQQTIAFAPVVARTFRIVLENPGPSLREQAGLSESVKEHAVAQIVLHTGARVNRFEDKAGFSSRLIVDADDTPTVSDRDVIRKHEVVDLTRRMSADGSIDWVPPPGRWVILRFGASLLGRTNQSASRAGRGLEVDKLSRARVESYIERYLGQFEETLNSSLVDSGLTHFVTDSFEAGAQNWTDDLLEQFRNLRGYDALCWLPVLAGRVVESATASDKFLWDFRKTLADLIADAHYGEITKALRRRGLRRYGESHELGRAFIGDGMQVKKTADIPMGAIWAATPMPAVAYDADLLESASVAHIYGKELVAAEAFTALTLFDGRSHAFSPAMLKPVADRAMVMGVNLFVIHASVHQPDSKPGPGVGLGPFGQWFTRKEPWAEQAGAWINYLSRSSHLLQQGRFVADIAYLYGEDANVTSLFGSHPPELPDGYRFDFVSPDALREEFHVKDGKLRSRSGMEYAVLALDASTGRMSLQLLRKIRELVHAGVVLTGRAPSETPSLADDEKEFRAIVAELWSDRASECAIGAVLADIGITPDFTVRSGQTAQLRFLHRRLAEGDVYFVSTSSPHAQRVDVSFRVAGRKPELWRADCATIEPLPYRVAHGRTLTTLNLDPDDAIFVVFREPGESADAGVQTPVRERLDELTGAWELKFPAGLGAPERLDLESLRPWTDCDDAGARYFSGTATYHKRFFVASEWLAEDFRLQLDIGAVECVAEVRVNDVSAGILWKPPFRIDLPDILKPGENHIEIRVSNVWANRMIGDKQPGARRIASATFDPFKADSPLVPSGLRGPVTLYRRRC